MKQNSNTTSTAIRVPTYIYEKIETQSISEGTNVSTVINNILRKYITWDQFVSDIGFIFLQKPFLRTIFEEVPEAIIIRAAKTTCHAGMRDAISFIHGKIDTGAIIDVVKLWLSASNIPLQIIEDKETLEFRIHHNLGKKGSLYFGTLLSSLFSELDIRSSRTTFKDHFVAVIFEVKDR
ncbi:MAG: hypothetical protein L0H53_11995 [Candidatus Nitrosocosmicus sp.]|nr:hypothetical protein [Candidatus Nitrosocosmicus sp.]